MSSGGQERETLARDAAEVTPERLALWHDYPITEAGESLLVNAEWHGPRCRSVITRLYRDCDCSLAQSVVSIEVEAVIAHRLATSLDHLTAVRPCSACGVALADSETHWSLFPEPVRSHVCLVRVQRRVAAGEEAMSDDRMTVDSIRATWGGTGYGGAATPYQREAIDTVRFLLAELDDTITMTINWLAEHLDGFRAVDE